MSPEEKINALEGLLARVQSNAKKPRVAAAPAPQGNGASTSAAASGFEGLAEETTAVQNQPAPAAAAPPAPVLAPSPPAPAVAAAQEDVLEADDVELYEGDIIELEEEVETAVHNPAPPLAAQPSSISFDEEEPPASSRRPKAAESMDEALAGAADQLDEGREVPIVTPPPESGRQVATPAGLAQPRLPDDLLDTSDTADLNSGTHEVARAKPSTEQLGQTIDLEPPTHAPLELAEEPVPVSSRPSDLEVTLPRIPVPAAAASPLVAPPAPPPPAASKPLEPELVARQPIASGQTAEFKPRPEFKPSTFIELLDASLDLGKN